MKFNVEDVINVDYLYREDCGTPGPCEDNEPRLKNAVEAMDNFVLPKIGALDKRNKDYFKYDDLKGALSSAYELIGFRRGFRVATRLLMDALHG